MQVDKYHLLKIFLFLILAQVLVQAETPAEKPMTHVVICWFNDGLEESQLDSIIVKIDGLSSIPGIIELNVGKSIESEREIVDDSFSIAITMKFGSTEKMKEYLSHPLHKKFVEQVLKPNLKKIVVYDFEN